MKRRRQTLSLPAGPLRSRAHLLFTIHLTGLGLTRSILPRNNRQSPSKRCNRSPPLSLRCQWGLVSKHPQAPASLPCRMCAQRKRRPLRLPRPPQPVAVRQRLRWLPTLIGPAPRSNRAISPPRAGSLSEPQTVTRLRLGLRWPKPTIRRCWPAGGSWASGQTSRRPGACTRGLRRAEPKARESVCSPSDSKAHPRRTLSVRASIGS